jgi:probable phosphoglycerate mutase
MARVIICRHGNTFDKGDLVRRVGARTDLALSKSGIKQANFLAEQFSPLKSGYNFSKAYSSTLQRTKEYMFLYIIKRTYCSYTKLLKAS